ncbi:acyl-CoA dehydrogenase NM domain-like protein [Aulographum hederae CBS 113979]|uniref:Acyl-CoA dehydrogenase NM domain-like protein n=1 Tax=Aulographum hederae CBS 113979 TaxID=1176131 RepID=A0A6G1GV01_9PEZI|nr:acyl-CoA dehydrogenase NM domain-like protein [Aulographum hederae CBS 113979]
MKRCADAVFNQILGVGPTDRFAKHPQILEDLKQEARERGLWNLFLAKGHYAEGAGYSNLEYGLMAEQLGKSQIVSEVMNCAAPDTGNMEVLAKYGTQSQKQQWLAPLLDGKIRSAFLMTEPNIASSDATNIQLQIVREGNEYVLNGSKWWSSGAGDPRCELDIVMGKTDPSNPSPHKQQSVLLVPARTPGITVHRMLSVFGYDDAPHGHGHISFDNVRVPLSSIVLGEGRGFEIIQGRLARIHEPKIKPFGKLLHEHGLVLRQAAQARIGIDSARLVEDAKSALKEIAEAKVLVPDMLQRVIDDVIQIYGAEGISQDTPLAYMWACARTMRMVDGPDEVHLLQLGRTESKRIGFVQDRLERQKQLQGECFRKYGVENVDPLYMGWTSQTKPKL